MMHQQPFRAASCPEAVLAAEAVGAKVAYTSLDDLSSRVEIYKGRCGANGLQGWRSGTAQQAAGSRSHQGPSSQRSGRRAPGPVAGGAPRPAPAGAALHHTGRSLRRAPPPPFPLRPGC
jgi:hypothetical protein